MKFVKNKRQTLLLPLVVIAMIVLTACGGAATATTAPVTAPSAAGAASSAPSAAASAAAASAATGAGSTATARPSGAASAAASTAATPASSAAASTGATPGGAGPADVDQLALIEGVEFSNGIIEAEIAGAPAPNAPEGARGFVGLAFRVQPDRRTYDAFYLRPTNGRAEDQERRNRSAQYISRPEWPWARLRKETPAKYESYVDLVPGAWTKIRIEVRGDRARLYVHGNEQPTLIVSDVKSGATAKGGVALWLDAGSVAHFRSLTVTPDPDQH